MVLTKFHETATKIDLYTQKKNLKKNNCKVMEANKKQNIKFVSGI